MGLLAFECGSNVNAKSRLHSTQEREWTVRTAYPDEIAATDGGGCTRHHEEAEGLYY